MEISQVHKEADKQLNQTTKTNNNLYKQSLLDLKKDFLEVYSRFNINDKMSLADKMTEVNKYDRFSKLSNKIVEKLLETNKVAVKNVNELSTNVYQNSYNTTAKELGIKIETKTESKEDVKENQNPYQTLAVNRVKDYDQAKRSVDNVLLNAIVGVATPFSAFMLLKTVFEKNLYSTNLMATQQVTDFENLGVINALNDGQKEVEKNNERIVKVWNSMRDSRVRDAHARADGQEAELDKPFYVGGEQLMYPGDPNGRTDNIMGCRCWVTYKIVKI